MEELGRDAAYIVRDDGTIRELIVFKPEQVKSADPVTTDKDGNLIPLSQRFDESSDDINFRTKKSQAKLQLQQDPKSVNIQKRNK